MKKYFNLLIIIISLSSLNTSAQNGCDEYADSVQVPGAIIVAASIPGNLVAPDTPVFMKISPEGEIMWRVEEALEGDDQTIQKFEINYFSDNFIYAVIGKTDSFHNYTLEVWKINPDDGDVLWRSDDYYSEFRIIEYDQNTMITVDNDQTNGFIFQEFKVFTVERSTGERTLLYENEITDTNTTLNSVHIAADSKGNLIYSYSDNSQTYIRKINGLDFNSVIWDRRFEESYDEPFAIDSFFIDELDELYVFTEYNYFIYKINTDTGEDEWSLFNNSLGYYLTDYEFRNGYLYISRVHTMYEGSPFVINRIDTETGIDEWSETIYTPEVVGEPTDESGDNAHSYSFAMDCEGDLYVTGAYGSVYGLGGEGSWVVMKIDGITGEVAGNTTITENPEFINSYSTGHVAGWFSDGPVFIGDLQYSESNGALAFAKTDATLENITIKKFLCSIDSDNDGIEDFAENTDGSGYVDNDDTDGDNIPNYMDNDDDGDGILTSVEGPTADDDEDGVLDYLDNDGLDDDDNDGITNGEEGLIADTDGDGTLNYLDEDDDNDGILTSTEGPETDTDNDGQPNYLDNDDDDDGILTSEEGSTADSDDDGIPDYLDNADNSITDHDNDGILTTVEGTTADTDNDGTPNYLDNDDDNDNIPTNDEEGESDTDNDGDPDYLDNDDDGDGILTSVEGAVTDTDDDGILNYLDDDDDNDEIPTLTEGYTNDSDDDGIPDYLDNYNDADPDADEDEDGIPTIVEGTTPDTDEDGTPDYLDDDDDNDGFTTLFEGTNDTDGDDIPDYHDTDDDGDGIPTYDEGPDDSDDDGIPDYLDNEDNTITDHDNDGIPTTSEGTTADTDNDGILNYMDSDDDGDGIATIDEDANGDGNPANDFSDPENPDLPDYLNPENTANLPHNTQAELKVHPVPTDGILFIEPAGSQQVTSLEIYSLTGALVYTNTHDTGIADISRLSRGLYLLKVYTYSGVTELKIIKN